MAKGDKISDKQKRFAEGYLANGQNATAAYKAAYPNTTSDTSAAACGAKLLRNAKVKEYINQRQQKLSDKLQITQEMVLEGYRRLAFYDNRKFFDENDNLVSVANLDEETAFALAGFEVTEEKTMNIITGYTKKIKMSDRKAALDGICRVLGFNAAEKKEHSFDKGFLDYLKETSE